MVGWDHDIRRQDPRDRDHGLRVVVPRHFDCRLLDRRQLEDGDGEAEETVGDIQAKNTDLTAAVTAAKQDLERAKSDHDAAAKQADAKIKALQDEVAKNLTERDAARATLGSRSSKAPRPRWPEAEQRLSETTLLRQQKSAVEKQANEYKLQQTELNDKIRELERQTKTLDDNNKDLRDRVAPVFHVAA